MMCKFTIAIITFSPAKLCEVSFLFLSDYRIKDRQTIGLSAYGLSAYGLLGRYIIWISYAFHAGLIWFIIKIHVLFCYYAIKRQISTKLIGENMFCPKAHQLSVVLPSNSRLVQLRIYTCYTKTCFFPWCYVLFFQNYLLLVNWTIQM